MKETHNKYLFLHLAKVTTISIMLTLKNFLEYAKREMPLDELPNYVLYAIRVYASTVVSGSEIMCRVFVPFPEALGWAQNCYLTTMAWSEIFIAIKADCATDAKDTVASCECILQKLTPVIAQSNAILENIPSVDFSEESDNKVFNVLKLGLERLSKISLELEQQNLSWLKEFMDREAANR
ncbi:MAG: hypothetical protein QM730_20720 [Anaerolineales bacterium]